MKLVYTGPALRDLDRLKQWIAVHNRPAARRRVARLKHTILQLKQSPLLGIAVEESADIRDLIADDYIVRYHVNTQQQAIYSLHIWHGREDER